MIDIQKKYRRVGIDIGSFSVKVVALEKGIFDKSQTLSYAIEYLPQQATAFQISECIKRTLSKAGITTLKVNISVSGPEVIFRYLQFPLLRDPEIVETIKLEWDKYIPFKLEEVIWDFEILNIISDPLKGRQKLVLLVATKKDFLTQQMHLIKDAGLEPDIIDTNVTCLVNTFNFFQPEKSKNSLIALINIGELVANLIILKDGIPRFSRDILFGGRDITHLIAQKKRLNFQEAQELKHNFKGDDEEVLSTINSSVGNLINEISLSFEYLKQELQEAIKTIYISGGTLHLHGIKESLHQGLGINIETWKLNNHLAFKAKTPKNNLEECFPELVVALGLALPR